MRYLTRQGSARLSAAAATLCAVHCAVTPVAAAAVPFLAVASTVEWGALIATVALGGGVTLMGPAWRHGRIMALLGTGALIWAASLAGALEPIPEAASSPVGSTIFAFGMLLSARACRAGECERCAPLEGAPLS